MKFKLLSINDVNEVEETMKTSAFLTLFWKDSELQWTPKTFGSIEDAFWPQVLVYFAVYMY